MLITEEDMKVLPKLGETDGTDAIAYVKVFHPMSSYTAYITEYDPVEKIAFGLVVLFEVEFGYISLDELESVVVGGLKMERDLYFEPKRISEIKKELEKLQ